MAAGGFAGVHARCSGIAAAMDGGLAPGSVLPSFPGHYALMLVAINCMCVFPQNPYVETCSPDAMALGDGRWLGHERGDLMNGFVS